MTAFLEKVARGIAHARGDARAQHNNELAGEGLGPEHNWHPADLVLARAAVEAMREPDEAQLNAARDWSVAKYGLGVGNDAATGCYQAMIGAALGEEGCYVIPKG